MRPPTRIDGKSPRFSLETGFFESLKTLPSSSTEHVGFSIISFVLSVIYGRLSFVLSVIYGRLSFVEGEELHIFLAVSTDTR
jgi:hypothetical protein